MSKTSKGMAVYLLLSFGGAWTLWLAAALLFDVSPRSPLFQLLLLPGAFAPAVRGAGAIRCARPPTWRSTGRGHVWGCGVRHDWRARTWSTIRCPRTRRASAAHRW